MKKFFVFAAIAALVLASCAKTESYVKVFDNEVVSFGAYSGRTVTKGGPTVDMNLDSLKKYGFGVFATYTELKAFEALDQDKGANDNFMANQQVAWDGSAWTYSPVKYWPNPTNGQNADDQMVSFFAYAPYTDSTSVDTSYGITGFSTAVALDKPNAVPADTTKHVHNFVHYTFVKDKPNVDLMWGYRTKNVDTSTDPATVTYTINNNLTRTTDKVHFVFQHLLSKLGGSQDGAITDPDSTGYVANGLVVKAKPVSLDPTNGFGTATGTKITISRIVIGSAPATSVDPSVKDIDGNDVVYANGAQTAKLDLYTGEFQLDAAAQLIEFHQEITNDPAELTANPATADNELTDRLKEPLTAITDFDTDIPKGVTEKAVNVYKSESNPVILVPGTKPVIDITLTYTVRTYDAKLPKGYSEVPQTVFGRIKFDTIKKNTKYNIVMIIGLNDVEFSAEVENWSTGVVGQVWHDDNGDGVQDANEMYDVTDTEIGLPSNL
jgi:hypothetical protein